MHLFNWRKRNFYLKFLPYNLAICLQYLPPVIISLHVSISKWTIPLKTHQTQQNLLWFKPTDSVLLPVFPKSSFVVPCYTISTAEQWYVLVHKIMKNLDEWKMRTADGSFPKIIIKQCEGGDRACFNQLSVGSPPLSLCGRKRACNNSIIKSFFS